MQNGGGSERVRLFQSEDYFVFFGVDADNSHIVFFSCFKSFFNFSFSKFSCGQKADYILGKLDECSTASYFDNFTFYFLSDLEFFFNCFPWIRFQSLERKSNPAAVKVYDFGFYFISRMQDLPRVFYKLPVDFGRMY